MSTCIEQKMGGKNVCQKGDQSGERKEKRIRKNKEGNPRKCFQEKKSLGDGERIQKGTRGKMLYSD